MKGDALVLAGMREGAPRTGPLHVHVDITNGCNAACVTCWDHSPLLTTPRPSAWKRGRLPLDRWRTLLTELDAFGSVRGIVLSGMGEPLTHPDVYTMLADTKARGWHVTLMTNLVAADRDALLANRPDQVLVGVHGVTPETYLRFHPGWTERHFFTMCQLFRALQRAGTRVRHVQVINRDTAPEVPEMVRFGALFRADRVNFKLASLADGTEACAIDAEQRAWLLAEGIPRAEALAATTGVATNLPLFRRQVEAGSGDTPLTTAPMAEIGCHMGFVYTRVTVDEEVLYCCNTEVRVGSLREASLREWWTSPRWQALRDTLRAGRFLRGCERCGKVEQNVKWAARLVEAAS